MTGIGKYPLQTFVHRVLVKRVVLVAVAVAILLAGVTWIQMRGRIEDHVARTANDRLAVIRTLVRQTLTGGEIPLESALEQALRTVRDVGFDDSTGHFVFAVFRDPELTVITTVRDSSYTALAAVENYVSAHPVRPSPSINSESRLIRVAGHRCVRVVAPVTDRTGAVAARVDAVFALSPAAAAHLTRGPLETILYVIGVVLVVIALLYPVILSLARRLAEFSGELLEANLEMMEALGCAISKRDSDTDAHNYRVTIYAVRLAERVGLGDQQIRGLIKGAFLHDIGKIGIRDEVLLKPARLDEQEFAIMQSHVHHGLDIVRRARWLDDAVEVVGCHHEKYAGGGYPGGAPGDLIPLTARIFAIVDVFDALTSARPYKQAYSFQKALDILTEGRGTHFEPALLAHFKQIAEPLHRDLAHSDADGLSDQMRDISQRYFNVGLESLIF